MRVKIKYLSLLDHINHQEPELSSRFNSLYLVVEKVMVNKFMNKFISNTKKSLVNLEEHLKKVLIILKIHMIIQKALERKLML